MSRTAEEIERKYIIAVPDDGEMRKMPDYGESEITQIYLASPDGETHRIRKRVYPDRVVYTETKKVRIDGMSCEETEREISGEEYLALTERRDESRTPIEKRRVIFRFGDQLFEVDLYPGWKKTCILETELRSRGERPPFPAFLRVIREVTGVKGYSNADMAKAFPKEDKIEEM